MAKNLDVRGLPHPERPPLIFNALSKLDESEILTLLVEIEPIPMYRMLGEKGYSAKGERLEDGSWRVEIRKKEE